MSLRALQHSIIYRFKYSSFRNSPFKENSRFVVNYLQGDEIFSAEF